MASDSFLDAAFDAVITAPEKMDEWYVVLWCDYRYYGGPEEGGWWGTDSIPVKFKIFPTEKLAEEAAERIKVLADELSAEADRRDSEYCRQSMEWLEARGLEASYFPEPDGPEEYWVSVTNKPPVEKHGPRHYE